MPDKEHILAGRKAIDGYRTAHEALYAVNPHRRSLPEEHTPLLNDMLKDLKGLGFNNISEALDVAESVGEDKLWH